MQTGETRLVRSPAPAGLTERSRPRPAPSGPRGSPGAGSGAGKQRRVNSCFNSNFFHPAPRTWRRGWSGQESAEGARLRRKMRDSNARRLGPLWQGVRESTLAPPAAPKGKDGETELSSLRTSETNFYLIASLKNKTSAVPPRRFLPVEEMEIAEKPPLLHSSISAVTHA